MALTDTVAAAAYAAIRTNLPAAQVTIRQNAGECTGLMVDVSEAKRTSLYGADPGYQGRVWILTSELPTPIGSLDTFDMSNDGGTTFTTYRARQVDELAGITRIELESEFPGE